ncbi:MAG: ABC-2 transporter permease [Erysipelotrichaceae bacterium]|nr:ABC-2 transporter permease [Erysipelotrichaceae bacterium]
MKGLIVKDLYLNFRNLRTILMYLIICVIMGFSMDGSFIVGYASMLFGIMAVGTISYDELDNGLPFLMSLPVDRQSYVTEKFVYSLIMEAVGTLFGVAVYVICSLIRGQPVDIIGSLPFVLAIMAVMTLIISGMIVIELKFGAEKSRMAMLVIYGVIAVIMLAFAKIPGGSDLLGKLIDLLESVSPAVVAAVILLIIIVLDLALYLLGVKIMKNKEF